MTDPVASVRTCLVCGFTESDFARTLRFGCPHCYETFGANLETMLPRMHRGTTHVGKRPSATRELQRELREIESLLRVGDRPPEQADALLDRWQAVQIKLRANSIEPASNVEEVRHP